MTRERAADAPRGVAKAIVFGFGGAAFAAGFGLFYWGASAYEPLDGRAAILLALRWSLPAAAAFVALAFAWHRAGRLSRDEFLRGSALGVLGFLFLGYGGTLVVNGALDRGPPRERLLPVVHKERLGESPQKHYLYVPSPVPGRDRLDVLVPWHEYRRVEPGRSHLRLVTRPGRLGLEWVVRRELEP